MFLHELPYDHPNRNCPLAGFYYRLNVGGGGWREIKLSFRIAKNTYNQLGAAWTETSVFSSEANGNSNSK
jgi:hypothetical protein